MDRTLYQNGENRFCEIVRALFRRLKTPPLVESIAFAPPGDITFHLTNGLLLQLFADGRASDSTCWILCHSGKMIARQPFAGEDGLIEVLEMDGLSPENGTF